jgi:hypothetical protein
MEGFGSSGVEYLVSATNRLRVVNTLHNFIV